MSEKIAVLAAGSFGTAISIVAHDCGHNVKLYTREKEQFEEIKKTRINSAYLKDVKLPEEIELTMDIEYAINSSDIIINAVPTQNVRGFLETIKEYMTENKIFVNLAKGLEIGTNYRISQIYDEVIGYKNYVAFSGPSHAEELAIKMPTTVVVCSEDMKLAKKIQNILSNNYLRIYTNPDLIGVELGGSLKNIIALASGVVDGMGYGDNTKAALITRGMHEITRLGVKLGADRLTFSGLTGVGDLVVTCTSMNSRNLRFGILVGQGKKPSEALKEIGMVVEGMSTCKAAYQIAKKLNISMPITENLYAILYENKNLEETGIKLMNRKKKSEISLDENEEEEIF